MKHIIATLALFVASVAHAQVQGPNGTLQQGIPATPTMQPAVATPAPTPAPAPVGMNVDPPPSAAQQAQAQQAVQMQQFQEMQQQIQQQQLLQMQQQAQQQKSQQTAPPYAAQQSQLNSQSGNLTPDEVARRAQQQLDAQQQRSNAQPNMVEQAPVHSEIIPVLPPAQKVAEIRAVLRTSVGDITIKLNKADAPQTVDYFMGLAKGDIDFIDIKTSKPVKRPFYNGLVFNRVVKNTLIQTGDPFGNGRGDSGKTIPDEIKPAMKFDRPGMVAMAPARDPSNTSLLKNSNSSQFFITLREVPEWNGQFTIFGQVEDGMDVVQKIANSKVGPTERPIKRIYLVAVEIIESNK